MMLKLEPSLNESTGSDGQQTIPYRMFFNHRLVGTFTLYVQTKESYQMLCGWADQYEETDYPWLRKGSLARFVNSSELILKKPCSFAFVGDLEWMVSPHQLFLKTERMFCLVDYLILQLETLRTTYQVDRCYFSLLEIIPEKEQWELTLEGFGFFPASKDDAATYFVSHYHLCSDCCEWIPIEETLCLSCHQQQQMNRSTSN